MTESAGVKGFRSWVFTLNNYTEDDWNFLPKKFEDGAVKYLVQAKEIGEKNTPHIQGFVHFKSNKTLGQLKKWDKRTHWEPKNGTFEQAAAYCKKGEQPKAEWEELKEKGPNFGKNANFIELGTLPHAGTRSDLHALVQDAKDGKSLIEMVETHGETGMKYMKSFREVAYQYALQARYAEGFRNMQVHIYYGATSTGKSKAANEIHGYPSTRSLKNTATGYWFDGVDKDTKTLVFDEFNGDMAFSELLNVTDGQPKSFQIKGSMTVNWWDTVVLTTNQDPRSWYPNMPKQQRDAFWARVTKVIKFTGTCLEDAQQVVELEKGYRDPVPFTFKTYIETPAMAEGFKP